MKFLCVDCDAQMEFEERESPGDGTLTAAFRCPACGHRTAMLTNPMETRLVSSLGVEIGGSTVPEEPMQLVRETLDSGRDDAFRAGPTGRRVAWSPEARHRLERVPSFVRGMVRRVYTDYARDRGLEEITPEVMDRARAELGLEGM
ncbi:MAG: PCP reductase family protein [Gemmatimonadota bacterium]